MQEDKSNLIKIIICVCLALGLLSVVYTGVSSAREGSGYSSFDESDWESEWERYLEELFD